MKYVVLILVLAAAGFGIERLVDFGQSVDYSVGYAPTQPINFSHKIHAGDNNISCLYCHYGADKGKHAAIPPANLCMNCHSFVRKDSKEVQKIYSALEEGKHIKWEKVHYFPDFAVFNHSVHVNSEKVSCKDCHGDVASMNVLKQKETLSMGFCLECHKKNDPSFSDVSGHEDMEPGELMDCASCHY